MSHGFSTMVLAEDGPTSEHMRDALLRAGLTPSLVCHGTRGWSRVLKKAVEDSELPILVLAPSLKLKTRQLESVRAVRAKGGAVYCWGEPDDHSDCGPGWLLEQLLLQVGAETNTDLSAISACATLFAILEGRGADSVRMEGKRCQLTNRVISSLENTGVPVKKGAGLCVEVREDGTIHLGTGDTTCGPWSVAQAACAIRSAFDVHKRTGEANDDNASFEIDDELVGLIVRPPTRLLSETTSKRLCAAFGFRMLKERLCASPTDAVRFSAEVDNEIVLKLVRPSLEGKSHQGAVFCDLSSASELKRAYHTLETLGSELSPPKPLGILAATRHKGGSSVWLRMKENDVFGRYVEGGKGDAPNSHPDFAVAASSSPEDVRRALARCLEQTEELGEIAREVSRFSFMVDRLGEGIQRAEIHPLAAGGSPEGAYVLDAIIGIRG